MTRTVCSLVETTTLAGGNEAGLDASESYTVCDFTGFEPDQQGFHVKLTINAEGSQGADTKHKVFWVEPCPPKPTPTDTRRLPRSLLSRRSLRCQLRRRRRCPLMCPQVPMAPAATVRLLGSWV